MAKSKLDLYSKTDGELEQFAQTHQQKLTGNPHFTSPIPATVDFGDVLNAFSLAIDDVEKSNLAFQAAVSQKNQSRELLIHFLIQRGSYVDTTSAGDPTRILAAGFEVADNNRTPIDLIAPGHPSANFGDSAGAIDLTWDATPGARAYVVECRLNDETAPWQQATFTTRSRTTINNLQSGRTYAFRIKAIGAKGESPWSIVIVKNVA